MDPRPSTSRANYPPLKTLSDLSLEDLERLLQKNREIQHEVKSTMNLLVTEINEAVALREVLQTQMDEILTSQHSQKCGSFQRPEASFRTISYPYFLDSKEFPPPPNKDDREMIKNKFITLSALHPAVKWKQSQMKFLDAAVKKFALEKMQIGLKEKKRHLQAKLDEKRTCQVMLEDEMLEDEMLDKLREKLAEGRSIAELEQALVQVEEEINEKAGEPLKKLLKDRNVEHDWLLISAAEFGGYRTEREVRAMWRNCLYRGLARKPWSEAETRTVMTLAQEYEQSNWEQISERMGGHRSGYQIFIHYQAESNKVRNVWTETEDNAVIKSVQQLRMGNYIPFSSVADTIPGRNAAQVAQRWRCHLDPSIFRGSFTSREDIMLIICRLMKKMSYREISDRYICRSEDQLRKRYFSMRHSATFGEIITEKNQMKIKLDTDMAMKSLTSDYVQRLINKKEAVHLKRVKQSKYFQEVAPKQLKKWKPLITKRGFTHCKFVLQEETEDGQKVLKIKQRRVGGRIEKPVDKGFEEVAMFFFTMTSQRKGRLRKLCEDTVPEFAKSVQDICKRLSTKLVISEEDIQKLEEKTIDDRGHALFMQHFSKLVIEDLPINNIIPPHIANIIGHRSLILDLNRLEKQKLSSPQLTQLFENQCLQAGSFMSCGKEKDHSDGYSNTCQNLHLVPGDSARPTVTLHLHNGSCDGKLCFSNKSPKPSEWAETKTVCGNVQEFYMIRNTGCIPRFRLIIQKGGLETIAGHGRELLLENKEMPPPPVVDLDLEEQTISPEDALQLWKKRFVALFTAPAVLEMFSPPENQEFGETEQGYEVQPAVVVKKPQKRTRPKGKLHWKVREKREKSAQTPEPEVTEPKSKKKRRTQGEMIGIYKQMAQENANRRLSRRTATATSSNTEGALVEENQDL